MALSTRGPRQGANTLRITLNNVSLAVADEATAEATQELADEAEQIVQAHVAQARMQCSIAKKRLDEHANIMFAACQTDSRYLVVVVRACCVFLRAASSHLQSQPLHCYRGMHLATTCCTCHGQLRLPGQRPRLLPKDVAVYDVARQTFITSRLPVCESELCRATQRH